MHCFRKNLCSSPLSDWILQFESRPWLCCPKTRLFIYPIYPNSKLNHCVLIDRAWAQFVPSSLSAASDWLCPHVVLLFYLLNRTLSTTTMCSFAACVCLHFNEQSSLFCLPALATFFSFFWQDVITWGINLSIPVALVSLKARAHTYIHTNAQAHSVTVHADLIFTAELLSAIAANDVRKWTSGLLETRRVLAPRAELGGWDVVSDTVGALTPCPNANLPQKD